jgi:ATP-dependent Lon protease
MGEIRMGPPRQALGRFRFLGWVSPVSDVSDLAVRELPLFPLPDVVLFPQEVLPLHIFEPRYRMMLRTVLAEDRRFGVVRWDPQQQQMAEVGCCAEVIHCQTQEDDRSNIVTMGQQRFRVLDVLRETPYRVAMVSWIEDEVSDSHATLDDLSQRVNRALRDVVELTGKLIGKPASLPADVPDLPRELSFWIGAHLGGPVADHQQALLEITDTGERLRQEFELLDETRRQLAARTVLQDTLGSLGRSGGDGAGDRGAEGDSGWDTP